MTVPAYPPPFANDDPLRRGLAFNEEFWRIQKRAETEPEQAEVELQALLDCIRAEKAAK